MARQREVGEGILVGMNDGSDATSNSPMIESLRQFVPSGAELAGNGVFGSTLGVLEIATGITGAYSVDPDDFEAFIPRLAREATSSAFREAESGPVGATIIRDGWICRVRNGEVVERIMPAPKPFRVQGGDKTYKL